MTMCMIRRKALVQKAVSTLEAMGPERVKLALASCYEKWKRARERVLRNYQTLMQAVSPDSTDSLADSGDKTPEKPTEPRNEATIAPVVTGPLDDFACTREFHPFRPAPLPLSWQSGVNPDDSFQSLWITIVLGLSESGFPLRPEHVIAAAKRHSDSPPAQREAIESEFDLLLGFRDEVFWACIRDFRQLDLENESSEVDQIAQAIENVARRTNWQAFAIHPSARFDSGSSSSMTTSALAQALKMD